MLKIILVHPLSSLVGWNANNATLEANLPSLGLCYIAGMCDDKKIKIEMMDARNYCDKYDFLFELQLKQPDIIAFHCQTINFEFVKEMAQLAKERIKKEIKICVGGIHPTLKPDDFDFADYTFCGEGEKTFADKVWETNGEKIIQCERVGNLDNIPHPKREIYKYYKLMITQVKVPFLENPTVDIITARGCPHTCRFCYPAEEILFGKIRRRSENNVIEEIKELYKKYNFKGLFIHDDTFTFNLRWIENFCDEVMKLDFKFKFLCQGTVKNIIGPYYKEVLQKMKQVGLEGMIIGFESGSQRILDFLRKEVTVEENIEVARILKELGIKIWANYMLGIPTEEKEDIDKTIEMIKKISPEHHSPAFYTPHIGSELYDYCQRNDLILLKNYDEHHRCPDTPKIKGIDYSYINKKLRGVN